MFYIKMTNCILICVCEHKRIKKQTEKSKFVVRVYKFRQSFTVPCIIYNINITGTLPVRVFKSLPNTSLLGTYAPCYFGIYFN